jgi:3-hydroxybutyryl-CoA dehydrogenase
VIIPEMTIQFHQIGIVGAGAMGRGIAQIAAQAGSQVFLFDMQNEASETARVAIFTQWDKLADKGRLDPTQVAAFKARVTCADSLTELGACDLVVEAVIERLDVKSRLFSELESIVREDAVLATNTSSLSVTAIAAQLKHPQRFAGFHFFNPVPLMKLVEVIGGLKTEPSICAALSASATPVAALVPRRYASSVKVLPTSPRLTAF